ncbi:MAG: DUF6460 domain-containing protein [Pseudomonadota bacterium]
MQNALILLVKLLTASVLLGAVLSAFNMSAADILLRAGLTPERLWEMLVQAVNWAVPNMVLGCMIILPLWALVYVLRPPRG